jgi:hypothetical protein
MDERVRCYSFILSRTLLGLLQCILVGYYNVIHIIIARDHTVLIRNFKSPFATSIRKGSERVY